MRRERGPFRYRRMQVMEGLGNDAYRPGAKPKGPVICPKCGAIFNKGRWRWGDKPAGAVKLRCPACLRIAERLPAGFISLSGSYFTRHRKEILERIRHCEQQENAEHPLERIMAIENEAAGGAIATTTSVHLARLIGHALQHAFKGELSRTYGRDDNVLRVRWSRAA